LSFFLGLADTREAALALTGDCPPSVGAGTPFVISPVVPSFLPPERNPVPEAFAGALRHLSGYGGFSTDGSEYVIRMPWEDGGPRRTPMPWTNCIANHQIGVVVSEVGLPAPGRATAKRIVSRRGRMIRWAILTVRHSICATRRAVDSGPLARPGAVAGGSRSAPRMGVFSVQLLVERSRQ